MKWRVVVELAGAGGIVQSHDISVGVGGTIDHSVETLGLTLAEGKKTLAGLQLHLVQAHCVKKTRKRHAVREMEVDPSEPLCRRSCVKKTRKRHAVREMKVDPSKSLCRKRLQTAMSCFGQKPRW